jgi:hypothetical protein
MMISSRSSTIIAMMTTAITTIGRGSAAPKKRGLRVTAGR